MADDQKTARYRKLYARLLRLYPQPYRERFGEGMEQTFHDLCRERAGSGKALFTFALWTFCETFIGIMRENISSITLRLMQNKSILRIALVTALLLLVPLLGRAPWSLLDFVFMGSLLFGTGLTYELVAKKGGTIAYRAAVGIACAAGLLLVWINAAVGIIGDEDLANAMYFGVLAVGFIGAFITRFQPREMARALVATAVAQALVPVIALTWVPATDFAPGVLKVFALNAIFVALWVISALLFWSAARKQPPAVAGLAG